MHQRQNRRFKNDRARPNICMFCSLLRYVKKFSNVLLSPSVCNFCCRDALKNRNELSLYISSCFCQNPDLLRMQNWFYSHTICIYMLQTSVPVLYSTLYILCKRTKGLPGQRRKKEKKKKTQDERQKIRG